MPHTAKRKFKIETYSPLKLTFPKIPPAKAVPDEFWHKANSAQTKIGKVEFDKAAFDPRLDLVASQRRLNFMTKQLEERRGWAKGENEKLKEQWKDLEEKELSFQDTFKKMSSFISSTEEKRKRAEKVIGDHREFTKNKIKANEALQEKISTYTNALRHFHENIADLQIYEKYLNEVSSVSDFKNPDNLLERYEALVTTRNILGKRQEQNLAELETARLKTTRMVEEERLKILGYNNKVAELLSRFSTVSRRALDWESLVLDIRSSCYKKYAEISAVKQSCWNMYLLICKRKGETPSLDESDVEQQLLFIKQMLHEIDLAKNYETKKDEPKSKRKLKRGVSKTATR